MDANHFQGNGRLLNVAVVCLTVFSSIYALPAKLNAGALENYVNQPDASYNWKRTEQTKIDKATVTHLELVSQTWRGQFWSHHLQVVRPAQVRNPGIALITSPAMGMAPATSRCSIYLPNAREPSPPC